MMPVGCFVCWVMKERGLGWFFGLGMNMRNAVEESLFQQLLGDELG